MKFKFLAMAAAVAATATSAGAADLNKPAKAAVDYVKVCDAYGAGFFYIPGSDTCLKIGGRVYFDVRTGGGQCQRITGSTSTLATNSRVFNPFYTRDAIYVNLDARTNTEFGLLRSFEDIRVRYTTAAPVQTAPELDLDLGFIQWGGLTVGKARSFFDFQPIGYSMGFDFVAYQTNTLINTVAYTANFGNGVTGTIGLQDSSSADSTYNNLLRNEGATVNSAFTTEDTYGGNQQPDVVANLNIAQAWGSAQIAGALHQDYSASAAVGAKEGYALNAGVEFKLDQIAKGDKIAVGAGYAVGAVGFLTPFDSGSATIGKAFRPGNYIGEDWAVVNGSMQQSKTWGGVVSFEHNFNPNFTLDLDGSVVGVSNTSSRSETTSTVAGTLKWIPTADRNFYIGFEAEYGAINYTSATKTAYAAAAPTGGYGTIANMSGYEFGIRVNRGF